MQIRLLAGGFVLGTVTALVVSQAVSQDQHQHAPSPDEMQQMMEVHYQATTPGEHHKKLEAFVGNWDITTRIYWGGPGGEMIETKGTSSVEWVLDGRFISETMHAAMMMPDMATGELKETKWEGRGLTGYDNFQNMYVSNWADSLSTHLLSTRGGVDPSGKTWTAYGQMDEPMLGVKGRTVKYVTRIIDRDNHTFEIIDLHAGDDYKVIEILYTRQ